MNKEIIIRPILSTEAFEELREPWQKFTDENQIQSAMLTWEWLFSWWQVFGEEKELWILTAWRGDDLIGIAPLMFEKRKKNGISLCVLCTLGAPKNDVGGFLLKDDDAKIAKMLRDYIFAEKKKWDLFELNEFLEGCIEVSLFSEITEKKNLFLVKSTNVHYLLPIERNWEDYYASLSSKYRKNLRRAERNSGNLGEVSFKGYSGDNLCWENFEEVIAVNCHANFPTLCASKEERAFVAELFKRASASLLLYILYINEEPVAYEYGFLYQNRFEDWRAGFDTRIPATISIGKFLSQKVLEEAYKNNIKEVDFMRGDQAYKRDWQPDTRNFVQFRFFRKRSVAALVAYFWSGKIKPFLKVFLSR